MGCLLEVQDLLGVGGSKLGLHSGQGSVVDSRVVSRGQQGAGLVLASRARQGGLAASRRAGIAASRRAGASLTREARCWQHEERMRILYRNI